MGSNLSPAVGTAVEAFFFGYIPFVSFLYPGTAAGTAVILKFRRHILDTSHSDTFYIQALQQALQYYGQYDVTFFAFAVLI